MTYPGLCPDCNDTLGTGINCRACQAVRLRRNSPGASRAVIGGATIVSTQGAFDLGQASAYLLAAQVPWAVVNILADAPGLWISWAALTAVGMDGLRRARNPKRGARSENGKKEGR